MNDNLLFQNEALNVNLFLNEALYINIQSSAYEQLLMLTSGCA